MKLTQFGEFVLDLHRGMLLRGKEEVRLRPKAFDALKLLVENQGRLVSKAEMMDMLWPGVAVTEDSLAHCVMEVRKALGEAGPKMLRTVPGRGYLFEAESRTPAPPRKVRFQFVILLLAITVAGAGFWRWRHNQAEIWAKEVEALVAKEDYVKAFDTAQRVLAINAAEGRVLRFLNDISDDVTIQTEPQGAEVYLRAQGEQTAKNVGITPLVRLRVARTDYILTLKKQGYENFEGTLSSSLLRKSRRNNPWDVEITQKLLPQQDAKQGMVRLEGVDPMRLKMLSRPTEKAIELKPFWIDRFEVTNAEFQSYVDSGRYVSGYKDRTGLPGPADWNGGSPPKLLAQHPVTGVSWHEARGYCQFRGKELPNMYQWEFAARENQHSAFALLYPWGIFEPSQIPWKANLQGTGTTPVGSYPFGATRSGVQDVAGNVREWLLNARGDGYAVAGASWQSETYEFLMHARAMANTRSADLGFRCALSNDRAGSEAMVDEMEVQVYPPPPSAAAFEKLERFYDYPHTPLDARVVKRQDAGGWIEEEIRFKGAGGEEAIAYLYLPKGFKAPYQTIHFMGGSPWWDGAPIQAIINGHIPQMQPYVRAGRAIFIVVLKGFAGRPPVGQFASIEPSSQQYKEILKEWAIDMRRGVDYLSTRTDIDSRRIVFWNNSTTEYAAVMAALEPSYAGVVFGGAGLGWDWLHIANEVNPAMFTPHIRPPKLILKGKYDEWNMERTIALPFYSSLREPKQRVIFDGGHVPLPEISVPLVRKWLDDLLGPVQVH